MVFNSGCPRLGRGMLLLAGMLLVLPWDGAVAQDDSASVTGDFVEEIVVTGVRGALSRGLDLKRESASVVDGISSEDIVDFPDLNVSEALQRVTGVTINRVLGEGQRVSVRGLAPEFTRVTINGQTVTSGNAGREVDFDVFASELFTNVTLTKTPSASLIEGGLAATIDLRTARPFDFSLDGPTFAVSGQGYVNDRREEWDPRISALASQIFADGTVGILGSVSYSETSLRQDNVEGLRFISTSVDVDGDGTPEETGAEYPFIPRYLLETYDRERLGVTGALQLRPNENLDFNVDLAYATFETERRRYSIDGLIRGNDFIGISSGLPSIDSTGLMVAATLDHVTSRSENILTPEDEDLLLLNVDGAWRPAQDWEVRARFGYSEATRTRPEFRSVWQTDGQFSYDFSDRIFVSIGQANANFADPSAFVANQSRFETFDIDDKEHSFQADLERLLDIGLVSSVSAGVRYSDREKSQVEFDGRITVTALGIAPSGSIAQNLPVGDFFEGRDSPNIVRNWFVTDFDAVMADPILHPSGYAPPQVFTNSFVIEESTLSGYLQFDLDGQLGDVAMRGNVGARVLRTDQTSNGFNLVAGNPVAVSLDNDYTEVLPSANLVFEPTEDFLIRFAASRSLTRATLTQLQPGGSVAPTGRTARLGNPELNPFTADQYDVSLEYYFALEALAAFTYFYKDVDGFIANVTVDRMINAGTLIDDDGNDVSNEIFAVSQPVNGEAASVKGFEISFQTPFTFLPEPFDGLGILTNYTYVDSEFEINFEGARVKTLLPGQSKSSYNIIGYYENNRFSARLAYTWRDEYLDQFRPRDTERSNFIDAFGQFDLNVQYALTESLTLTIDALNLLEEEQFRYGETRDRNIRFSETGRFFLLGVRGKF